MHTRVCASMLNMQLVDRTKPAMDLIGAQIGKQLDSGIGTLYMHAMHFAAVVGRRYCHRDKRQCILGLRFELVRLSHSTQQLNFIASRSGPVVEAARVNAMQLAIGGFA